MSLPRDGTLKGPTLICSSYPEPTREAINTMWNPPKASEKDAYPLPSDVVVCHYSPSWTAVVTLVTWIGVTWQQVIVERDLLAWIAWMFIATAVMMVMTKASYWVHTLRHHPDAHVVHFVKLEK